jgi:hypothetical protein
VYLSNVLSKASLIGCIGAFAGLVLTAPFLHADDKPSPPPPSGDGYTSIPIHLPNGKTSYVRVQEQPKPTGHLSSATTDGKYDPSQLSLSKTSDLANKTFSSPSFTQSDSVEVAREQSFLTKSYFGGAGPKSSVTEQTFDTKAAYPNANTGAYNHTASGLDKSYVANTTDIAQNQTAPITAGVPEEQNRTANIGGHKIDATASPLASKTYTGPEADIERHEMAQVNQDLIQMKDLPNRPLTIDEVRALINHGIKPNTDSAPPPATKPLNDPDYRQEPSPAPPPLPSTRAPTPDTSDDDLPSPGMVAAQHPVSATPPENSEPLPTK